MYVGVVVKVLGVVDTVVDTVVVVVGRLLRPDPLGLLTGMSSERALFLEPSL